MTRGGVGFALPLVLVAAMLAIGSGIEIAAYGVWIWAPKLPLLALLAVAFVRARSGAGEAR